MSGTNGIIAGIGDFGISQIKDESVEAKDLAQQYAEDANSSLEALAGADFEGVYNIETNTPALTATPSPSLNNGKYYIINGSGNIGFAGVNFSSGQQMSTGDKLIKKGNQWTYLPLDIMAFYPAISQKYFLDTKPSVIAAGSVLTNPNSLTCHIAPAGTYTLPSGNVILTGNINFLFWDFASGWTWQSFDVGVKDGSVTDSSITEEAKKNILANTQRVARDNTKSAIVENRINYIFEQANLPVVRYPSSANELVTSTQIAQENNLKITDTGTLNDYVSVFDTGIIVDDSFVKAKLNINVLAINTASPAFGIGLGTNSASKGFLLRNNGSVISTTNYTADTILVANTNLAYVVGDVVSVQIEKTDAGLLCTVQKGSTIVSVGHDTIISGNILLVMRGSMNVEVSVDAYYQNTILKDIDDRLTTDIYSINNIINNIQTIDNINKGVSAITLGTAMSVGNTRIDNIYQITGTSTILLDQLQIGVEVGGLGKIKFFSKESGNVYNFEKEVLVNFISGINTFGVETFGDNFQLPIGCYIGVYSSVASFSGVLGSSGNSKFLNGDILSTHTFSDSDYMLQMKISYKEVLITNVKQDIENINSIVKYNTETDKLVGVNTITTGASGGVSRTRIDKVNVITGFGTILLKQFQIGCQVAGSAKIKFFTKNVDGTFNLIKEFSATFSVGINTFGVETFGEFTLFNNCYVGVYVSGLTEFSSVISPTNGVSGLFVGEANGSNINFSDSQHTIQYRLTYTDVVPKTLKQDVDILKKRVVYVSKSGSDSNIGDKENPFVTVQKAINTLLGSNGKIIIGEGDYRETLNFSNYEFENIELFSEHNSIVRIMGSQQLTGWTKTSGYTNIYQCAFSGTIPSQTHPSTSAPRIIFEDFNPSKQILESERLPQQRGLNYRLQYTEIFEVTSGTDLASSLAILDSQVGFYLNSGVLYIHTSNSTNPTSNGFSYEVPARVTNIVPSSTNKKTKSVVSLNSIKFFFSTSGWISSGFGKIIRHNCSIMGVTDNYGGWRDDSCEVLSYFDRAGGCSNDGFNQHFDSYYSSYATLNNLISPPKQIYVEPWAHDNKDDGMSCHIWGNVTVFGGLSEYNGDGGFVPANGGSYTCYNCIARRNNWNSDSSQAGFATANPATGTGREATTLICYNPISENNKYGFKTEGTDKNVMTLINPIARFNTIKDYRVKTGIMNTYNAKAENTNSSLHLQVDAGALHNKANLTDI